MSKRKKYKNGRDCIEVAFLPFPILAQRRYFRVMLEDMQETGEWSKKSHPVHIKLWTSWATLLNSKSPPGDGLNLDVVKNQGFYSNLIVACQHVIQLGSSTDIPPKLVRHHLSLLREWLAIWGQKELSVRFQEDD